MKKIVSNVLIVSTQLIIGGLFLFMLFSDSNEDNKVVVVENDNLNKMADAVSELFVVDEMENQVNDSNTEVDLITEEEKKAQEEAQAKAQAEEEARKKAEEEAQAKAQAEAEAQKKAEEEAAARNAIIASAGGYNSKPGAGFNVTTGNRTYSLSESEIVLVAGVVGCEAARNSKDDLLAVASVILNRADSTGNSPSVVVQSGFTCINHPTSYPLAVSVLRDALNGIRNNNYYSFNGAYSGVSNNYIVSNGNRYY